MTEPTFSNPDEALQALLDAQKLVLEILIAKRIVPAKDVEEALRHMSLQYLALRKPDASEVMARLRQFVADPQRAAARQLADREPQGQA